MIKATVEGKPWVEDGRHAINRSLLIIHREDLLPLHSPLHIP
jgi:hypothetical protein